MNNTKVTIRVDEDEAIVAMIDRVAATEGTTRTTIVRRAIRRLLGISLPALPECGNTPQTQSDQAA
jgi:predicted transcriptional regulator